MRATGDDRLKGTASLYQKRFDTQPLDSDNFLEGTLAASIPSPSAAGTEEHAVVSGICPATTYHLLLKVFDEWGNEAVSNSVVHTTEPPI